MRVLLMLLAVMAMAIVPAAAAQEPKTPAPAAKAARASKPAAAPASPINLNTATQAQLESLPGVGAKAAQRILDYRKQNGPFKKIEELMNVRGVGEKNFLKLKDQVSVGNAKADHDQPAQR